MKYNNQKGFTLIETTIVLIILAIIGALGFTVFKSINKKDLVSSVVTPTQTGSQNTKTTPIKDELVKLNQFGYEYTNSGILTDLVVTDSAIKLTVQSKQATLNSNEPNCKNYIDAKIIKIGTHDYQTGTPPVADPDYDQLQAYLKDGFAKLVQGKTGADSEYIYMDYSQQSCRQVSSAVSNQVNAEFKQLVQSLQPISL